MLTNRILGERLNIVGVVDRDQCRAERALAIKRADINIRGGYASTKIFKSLDEAGSILASESILPRYVTGRSKELRPRLVIDGFQPVMRGSTQPGHNLEMQLINLFPKAALFIEKPISSSEFTEVDKVRQALEGRIVSVGYMLRYLKGQTTLLYRDYADVSSCSGDEVRPKLAGWNTCLWYRKLIDDNGLQVMMTMATYLFA